MRTKNLLLGIVSLFTLTAFLQINDDSRRFLIASLSLDDENQELLSELSKFDYAPLLTTEWSDQIIGFIGNDYQRLYMKYTSVTKEADTAYSVTGKSMVRSNVCSFRGEIKLLHIRLIEEKRRQIEYNSAKRYGSEDEIARVAKERYMLLAEYCFIEDSTSKGTGIFKGILRMNFYIDNGTVKYNDFDLFWSDSFSNNQCVGTWTSYLTGVSKTCNWGEFRIPYSGDLDIGAGLFSPDSKYLGNGWYNYSKAWIYQDTEAQKKEREKWW